MGGSLEACGSASLQYIQVNKSLNIRGLRENCHQLLLAISWSLITDLAPQGKVEIMNCLLHEVV